MNEQLRVVSVESHGRRTNNRQQMWHVVLGRLGHKRINLYLTSSECADYGIEVPHLAVVQ